MGAVLVVVGVALMVSLETVEFGLKSVASMAPSAGEEVGVAPEQKGYAPKS